MDVYIFFITACLLTVSTGQESPQPTETTASPATTPAQTDGNTTDTTNSSDSMPYDKPTVHCMTGFGEDGVCTDRQFCVYGTAAIDKTLYARHGYVSPCMRTKEVTEVCCPPDFILKPPEPTVTEDFDF